MPSSSPVFQRTDPATGQVSASFPGGLEIPVGEAGSGEGGEIEWIQESNGALVAGLGYVNNADGRAAWPRLNVYAPPVSGSFFDERAIFGKHGRSNFVQVPRRPERVELWGPFNTGNIALLGGAGAHIDHTHNLGIPGAQWVIANLQDATVGFGHYVNLTGRPYTSNTASWSVLNHGSFDVVFYIDYIIMQFIP